MKRILASLILGTFVFAGAALGADDATTPVNFLVLKTSRGECRLCQSKKEKTKATIAGPFATREEATQAKQELIKSGECKALVIPDRVIQRNAEKKAAEAEK